jgi:hypothetical protein
MILTDKLCDLQTQAHLHTTPAHDLLTCLRHSTDTDNLNADVFSRVSHSML